MTRCPICKKSVDAADIGQAGGLFPFCSERCKLIDLGRWLSGAYQVPVEPGDDEQDETSPPMWEAPDARRRR